MNRRELIKSATALSLSGLLPGAFLTSAYAQTKKIDFAQPLFIPPLVDCAQGEVELTAKTSSVTFGGGNPSAVYGFNQSFLGPTIRMWRGQDNKMKVNNNIGRQLAVHWHGLDVAGEVDGGPHTAFGDGESWRPSIKMNKSSSTNWYHSHTHGETAFQAYFGLAGMLLVEDADHQELRIPRVYGVDDLPIIIQDKAFDEEGQLLYNPAMPQIMHGFRGAVPVVNGAPEPIATVPLGIVRLRILTAANSRIFTLRFADNRSFLHIGSEGGFIPSPQFKKQLIMAPGQRVEILVDFSDGVPAHLLSDIDTNNPMRNMGGGMGGFMRGMMGGMMGGGGSGPGMGRRRNPELFMEDPEPSSFGNGTEFLIASFMPDVEMPVNVSAFPDALPLPYEPQWTEPKRQRQLSLDMGMMGAVGMNGRAFDMHDITFNVPINETEIWEVTSTNMLHPFHIHGANFKILEINGQKVDYATTGMRDMVVFNGITKLMVHFEHPAPEETPYMAHCHILEHEDAGMMMSFAVG